MHTHANLAKVFGGVVKNHTYVLEQDPEVLSHLYDPMKSATWATQLAHHIVHLLKIRHGWAACKPGLGLAVTNGVCKEHELGWIRALSANQVANPPQLCVTNPDPQGFCGGKGGYTTALRVPR